MSVETSVMVRAGPSRRRADALRLEVGTTTETAATGIIDLPSPWVVAPTAPDLVAALLAAPSPVVDALLDRFVAFPTAPLLVDVRGRGLQQAAWEGITAVPPFVTGWTGWWPQRPVVRYSPRLDDRAILPMTLPVDVLMVSLGDWDDRPDDPAAEPLRHFRVVRATRGDVTRTRALLRAARFEIVHVRTRIAGDATTFGDPTGAGPTVASLRTVLGSRRRGDTRLVVVETEAASMPAAYVLAHHLAGRSGPTVVVADTNGFDFRAFYFDVTHDQELSWAFWSASQSPANVLLMAKGGDEVLSLGRAETVVRARAEEELQRAGTVLATVGEWTDVPAWAGAARDAETALVTAQRTAEDVRDLVYHYDRESGGMEPMTDATGRLDLADAGVAPHQTLARRVVNVRFDHAGRHVPASRTLAAGTTYRLVVDVGLPSPRSIVSDPVGLPEEELEPHYDDGRVALRVVVHTSDFTLATSEQQLLLPAPPAGSRPVEFTVVAPPSAGEARLRVAVYHDNNLLQSLLVTAVVADGEVPDRRGNRAVVEWALSTSFRDLDRFGPKTLNVLTNETSDGTHLFAVVGDGFARQLQLEPVELERKITEARGALQWVCGDPTQQDYSFEPDNRGDGDSFREHLSGLAEFGYDLYVDLVLSQGAAFEADVEARLAAPAVLQIASMRSAKLVFPWALVYDLPVVPHPSNRVCPDFEAALAAGASGDALADHACITGGCPHRDDTNVVCPSGFWGFRHVIEQPLSGAETATQGRMPTSDAVDTIAVAADAPVEILHPYSEDLRFHEEHRREVAAISGVSCEALSDLLRIGQELQRLDLDLVYFYCHGGNRRGKAWLGVGSRPPEELYATNLKAWNVRWPTRHPLVVINGCDTVGIRPDDLLPFTRILAWSRAAGVLGSEITIPETLGRSFGKRFLECFVAGESVGEVVRRLRFELLAGYNPLGLAYTPYGLAKLRIVRG